MHRLDTRYPAAVVPLRRKTAAKRRRFYAGIKPHIDLRMFWENWMHDWCSWELLSYTLDQTGICISSDHFATDSMLVPSCGQVCKTCCPGGPLPPWEVSEVSAWSQPWKRDSAGCVIADSIALFFSMFNVFMCFTKCDSAVGKLPGCT